MKMILSLQYSSYSLQNKSNLIKSRMQKNKVIGGRYKIEKTLFRVNKYLYARIFDKFTLENVIGCVYLYDNQQPGQILKMLLEKFSNVNRMANLILPTSHVKGHFQDRSASIFFMGQHIAPLQLLTQSEYMSINVSQMLKFTYDAVFFILDHQLCSLHFLHSHDIVHGNISLNSCYISKNKRQIDFALNILDTSTFHQELLKCQESLLFKSQSQQNGLRTSFKDDAECIIYILVHLISKGKMLSKQRYRKEWVNQSQLLRWKSMDFFKQMIQILPPQLEFLSQIFTIIKSLSRNQKPDYPKFIKKTFSKLKQKQNLDSKGENKKLMSGKFSMQKLFGPELGVQSCKSKQQIERQKLKMQSKRNGLKITDEEQEEILLNIDSDSQDNGVQSKISKLESTKWSFKTKKFWDEKVQDQE